MAKNLNLTDYNVINTLVTEIEKSEERNRKADAFDAWQIYSGNQYPYVLEEIKRTRPKSWKSYTISDVSVSKMITDKRSKAYKSQPKRSVSGNTTKSDALNNIYIQGDAPKQLQCFDTIFNCHKYSLMWVNWLVTEERYRFMALQPYEYSIVKDKDSGDLIAVILNYGNRDITAGASSGDGTDDLIAESQADSSANSKVYAMWSKDNYVVIKVESQKIQTATGEQVKKSITYVEQEENPNMENKLGIIPFVFLSSESSVDYPTKNPLANQSVTYNALMSEGLTSANIQGTGVSVLSYPEEMANKFKELSTGLTQTIRLPQSSNPNAKQTTFDYKSPSPALDSQQAVYTTYLKQILAEHGITTSQGLTGGVDSYSSGLERALANADVQNIIESNQDSYVQLEKSMFEIIKAWENFKGSSPFSKDDELIVAFKKPKLMVTDSETLANIEKMIMLGMIEKWEALVLFDPNLTEQQAKDKLKQIAQSKNEAMKGLMNGQNIEDDQPE